MKKDFEIHDEWLSFEIHPETPPEGMLLAERFSRANVEGMYTHLRQRGESLGITFGELKRLSNSRLAMEASEFARDRGKFDQFHEAAFHVYFTETQDIGRVDVIMNLATQAGLSKQDLQDALDQRKYASRLDEVTHEAHQFGITGAPTFIVNDTYKIVGAQPIEVFKKVLTEMREDGANDSRSSPSRLVS